MKKHIKLGLFLTILGAIACASVRSDPPTPPHEESYTAQIETVDNTTNLLFSLVPPHGSVVRVEARTVGNGQPGPSASYSRLGLFKCDTNGLVSQISLIAPLGVFEEDSTYETLLATDGSSITVRVAGNVSRTVKWTGYIKTFYSQ